MRYYSASFDSWHRLILQTHLNCFLIIGTLSNPQTRDKFQHAKELYITMNNMRNKRVRMTFFTFAPLTQRYYVTQQVSTVAFDNDGNDDRQTDHFTPCACVPGS